MDSPLKYSKIPFILKATPTKKAFSISTLLPINRAKINIHQVIISCQGRNKHRSLHAAAVPCMQLGKANAHKIRLQTLDGCKTEFSNYKLEYNANGGRATGHTTKLENRKLTDGFTVSFDQKTLVFPPMTSETTKMHGWPLPPFLKVEIIPEVLQGKINQESGKVDAIFKGKFRFSMGTGYKPPPLIVEAALTSEESHGKHGSARGQRLGKDGKCRLVGISQLGAINDSNMNSLLHLPAECRAEMNVALFFS